MTSSKQKNRSLYKVTCLITKTRRFAQKQSWNSHPQRCLPWTWRPMESEQIRTGQFLSVCYNYVTHTIVFLCPHRLHIKSPFPRPMVPLFCSLLAHRVLSLNEFVLNSSRCPIFGHRSASCEPWDEWREDVIYSPLCLHRDTTDLQAEYHQHHDFCSLPANMAKPVS